MHDPCFALEILFLGLATLLVLEANQYLWRFPRLPSFLHTLILMELRPGFSRSRSDSHSSVGCCNPVSGALVHFPSIPADLGHGMLPQTSFFTQSPMTLHKQQCALHKLLWYFAKKRKGRQKPTYCKAESRSVSPNRKYSWTSWLRAWLNRNRVVTCRLTQKSGVIEGKTVLVPLDLVCCNTSVLL